MFVFGFCGFFDVFSLCEGVKIGFTNVKIGEKIPQMVKMPKFCVFFCIFRYPKIPPRSQNFPGEKKFFFPIFRIFAKALAHTNRFFVQKMTGK